ncbi:hypothetical protein DSO57_1006042 [Entomophthora muscae]|nr:hypothetical protein DSO57_1006042 [Entomophthora muscae]
MNASRDFQIEKEANELGDSTLGLYDGNEFVALNDNSWSNQAAFYYRYSWGSFRANRFANSVKAQFLKLYDESLPPYRTVEEMLKRVDLLQYLFQTSRDVLINEWSAGPVYTDELFQAISRNIYASNSSLHSLAGAIALIAAQGSYTTVGGNDQFFQKYLEHSGATVHFNSPVTKIKRVPGDSDDLVWNRYILEAGGERISGTFDAVVLATPFHQSDIKVLNLDLDLEEVPYRTVYVAVIEDALVNPGFFHADAIPDVIFGFNSSESFTVIGHSPKTRRANIEAVEPISMEWLSKLFNSTLRSDQVTFQTWKAYPKMVVKESDAEEIFPPINLGPSFYYVNSVESAISCMEVEVMSGRNIARLVLDDLKA